MFKEQGDIDDTIIDEEETMWKFLPPVNDEDLIRDDLV